MDLNPLFTSPTSFRPSTSLSSLSLSTPSSSSSSSPSSDGALELFSHAGIKLVHGWLVDPETSEYETIKRLEDYDSAVNLIVEADVLTQGQLVVSEEALEGQASGSSGPSGSSHLGESDKKKVQDGVYSCPLYLFRGDGSFISIFISSCPSSCIPRQHPVAVDVPWPLHPRLKFFLLIRCPTVIVSFHQSIYQRFIRTRTFNQSLPRAIYFIRT